MVTKRGVAILFLSLVLSSHGSRAAPPSCECAGANSYEQSCLLGHLIDVISKLIKCQQQSTSTTPPTTKPPATEPPPRDKRDFEAQIDDSSSTESTVTFTTPTIVELTTTAVSEDRTTTASSTIAPTTTTPTTSTSAPEATTSTSCTCGNVDSPNTLYIPVIQVDNSTKPFDMQKFLKCLFVNNNN